MQNHAFITKARTFGDHPMQRAQQHLNSSKSSKMC